LLLFVALTAPAGAGDPEAAIAYWTDEGVAVAGLDGVVVGSYRDFQFFSLDGNVLAGSRHTKKDDGEYVQAHDAVTKERLFRIRDAFAPIVVAQGRKIGFLPDRWARRDPYGTSVWMRYAGGRVRRVFQLTGPRATVPRDPFQGDGSPLDLALDDKGRKVAITIGNDASLFIYDVWVVDVKTRDAIRMTRGEVSRYPSLSPSGERLAVMREVDHCGGPAPGYRAQKLQVMSTDGEGKQTLLSGTCDLYYTDPRWISEDELVAARLTRVGPADYEVDLVRIDAATAQVTELTADGDLVFLTASPSLQRVAYARSGIDGFFVLDLATEEVTAYPDGFVPHLSGEHRQV
jgi:hypothetical protein